MRYLHVMHGESSNHRHDVEKSQEDERIQYAMGKMGQLFFLS